MGLKEKFDKVLEKYREEKEKRMKIEKEMEEFLKHVHESLEESEALVISTPGKIGKDNKIIISDKWIGIENPLMSASPGFTCIPRENEQKYNKYVKEEGFFRNVLKQALEKPEEAKLEIIEVSPEIIAATYLDEYRRISSNKWSKIF